MKNIDGKIIQIEFFPPDGTMIIATNRAIYSFNGIEFTLLATTDMLDFK